MYFNGLVHPCSIKACSYLYLISKQLCTHYRHSCITWFFTYLFMQIRMTKCYICSIIFLPEKPLDVMYLDSFRLFPNVILHYPPSVALLNLQRSITYKLLPDKWYIEDIFTRMQLTSFGESNICAVQFGAYTFYRYR